LQVDASQVAAGTIEAFDESKFDRIAPGQENNGNL
jgi:hypothetical protein